jgi:hypothetical protein
MLVFLTWAFELAAATVIGGVVTGVALLTSLAIFAHAPRTAHMENPTTYATDDTGNRPAV